MKLKVKYNCYVNRWMVYGLWDLPLAFTSWELAKFYVIGYMHGKVNRRDA